MDKKVLKKFERFVDLSNKFKKLQSTIEEEVGFINDTLKLNVITTANSSTTGVYYNTSNLTQLQDVNVTEKTKTRAELHLEKAKEEAIILEEYAEYVELIITLKNYFCSLNSLNKLNK